MKQEATKKQLTVVLLHCALTPRAHQAATMDPHYFLSKSELLGWINDTLGLRLSKIEETANGAVTCQIMDALHPGIVNLKKVVGLTPASVSRTQGGLWGGVIHACMLACMAACAFGTWPAGK